MPDTGVPVPQGTQDSIALTDYNVHVHSYVAGGVSYVPRRADASDFEGFIWDGAIRQIDLSAIVPVGALGVVLAVRTAGALNNSLTVGPDLATYWLTRGNVFGATAMQDICSIFVLPIDADRIIDYQAIPPQPDFASLTVIGWFI